MATHINLGDVRTFKRGEGRAVVVGLGLWAERQGEWIHIHMTGPDNSHTTVTNNPDSVRFHRTLFRNLRRTLVHEKCWEFGEEGSEVEKAADEVSTYNPIPLRKPGLTAAEVVIQDRGER